MNAGESGTRGAGGLDAGRAAVHRPDGLASLTQRAQAALEALYKRLRAADCAAPHTAEGQLIRPLLSLGGAAGTGGEPDAAGWSAIAAVQLAHEASLVHDDVIDNAAIRRSQPTLASSSGIARALVEGDHLLTTAYRLAAASGSADFMKIFAHAIERTVAGEKLQASLRGEVLEERSYRRVVGMKSGELIGCAMSAVAWVRGAPEASELYVLGRRMGTLYQMLDDFLDYCPDTDTGKPALGDYVQQRWTWPLLEMPDTAFGLEPAAVATRFAGDGGPSSPMRQGLARLEREADMVRAGLAARLPGDEVAHALVNSWMRRAAAAVEDAEAALLRRQALAAVTTHAAAAEAAQAFFRVNSRTFSFAARLFPAAFRRRVTRVYAFCRLTDDLADGDETIPSAARHRRLDAWEDLARAAWSGQPSGIAAVDEAMTDAAESGVPFSVVEELIAGMRMDLDGVHYATLADLRLYSFRVAGVIGQWMTRMCGISDPWMLERAACLGHAMQLTNILRDVGEDMRRGRVYLPTEVLAAHGVNREHLVAAAGGGVLPPNWDALTEYLMARADDDYAAAMEATPRLPPYFRFAIVVAAHVYRGIHDGIRKHGYDNFSMRARTTGSTKLRLALRALAGSRIARQGNVPATADTAPSADAAPRQPARRGAAAGHGAGAALAALLLAGAPSHLVAAAPTHHAVSVRQVAAAVTTDLRTPVEHVRRLESEHAARPGHAGTMLDLTRALFFVAVDNSAAVSRGSDLVTQLRTDAPAFAHNHAPLILAYEGAFAMLEAKHGAWPPSRLRAVRAGLRRLDDAVAAAPDDVEIRYLRLVNTHYLPGFFGRRDSARQDLAAVQRLMQSPRHGLHPALVPVVAEFLRGAAD